MAHNNMHTFYKTPIMEEEKQTIHVLMVAFSSQGHINPMLRLGKHLQNKGLHVTLAVTEIFCHRIAKSHHDSTTATITTAANQIPSISGIDIVSFSDGLSLEYDRKNNIDAYMKTLSEFGPVNLTSLITSLSCDSRPKKFSCIINNPFVPWVADVASQLGIPFGMLWIQPCTLFAIYHGFYNSPEDFPTKENPEKSVNLPGLPLLQTSDLPSFVLPFNVFGSLANVFFESMKNIHKLRWVMANSFYELEKEVVDSISKFVVIKGVGPLVPSTLLGQDDHEGRDFVGIDMWKADDRCIEWLNQKEPNSVIYVSFGSLVVLSKTQMESFATALRESKRPFLWVVKPSEFPVTEGAGELPKGFLDETKEQGLVVPWCPQIMVLSHKSTACFVTHCGWNSMLETISAGVPIIAYPMWTDQPTNAKLMADIFGVGLRLRPNNDGFVESETIRECIEEIMDGPRAVEIRAKTAEWKSMARDAVASGGSSDRNIQEFIDDIVKLSSSHIKCNLDSSKKCQSC